MTHSISKKNVVTNILLLFSATAASQATLAISVLLTARPLGIDAFGQYSACFALTKMTSIFFNLGMDTWLLRDGRRGEVQLGKLTTSNLSVKFTAGLVWLGGILIASQFLDLKTYPQHLLILCALATWAEAILLTVTHSFNVSLKNQMTVALSVFSSSILLGGTIFLIFNQHEDPTAYVLFRIIAAIIAGSIGLIWFQKGNQLSTNWNTIRTMFKQIPPFALSDFLVLIYTQADITIIALLLGKQAAGAYSPASSILRAAFVIPSAVFLVMTPVISQLVAERSKQLSKAIRQTNLVLVVIGAILWFVTSLFGPFAIKLILGVEFAISGEILTILGPILFVKSCSYASAAVIIATGKQGKRVIVQGIVAALNVILNLLIIQTFKIVGVAWVYLVSETILLAGYMILAERGRIQVMQKKWFDLHQ